MATSDNSWREFELLVSRIEQLLVPKGAIVKSPDYILDKITGQKREVDASIQYKIGSVSILITIECRKRGNVQDDTWIEQLATKREKIGAAKTIAVSSKGFTKSAIKSAHLYGIELRRISEITDDEIIKQWMENVIITIEYLDYLLISVQFHFDTGTRIEGLQLSPEIQERIWKQNFEAEIIFAKDTNTSYTIGAIVKSLRLDEGIEVSSPTVRRVFSITLPKSAYYSFTNQGQIDVADIDITLDLTHKREQMPLQRAFEYTDLDRPLVQIAEMKFPLGPAQHLLIEVSKNL